MKQVWYKTALMVFSVTALAVITGCGSAPAALSDRPDWVINPPQDEELIYGMGSAVSTNESRGWRMAENRARMSISYQITALVQGMETDYQRQAGTDGNQVGQEFFEGVGRQVTENALSGARVAKRGIGKNGTYYVLVSYAESAVRNTISAQIDNEGSRYAEFKAREAAAAMDAVLAERRNPSLVETGGE
ncbi:MAG: LPP20 family lipoprotein [Spirochaetales bacterium]|jgi:hypothetical protein|nr:LPP20 family lipoprotein [Spirochaetales bacterium]